MNVKRVISGAIVLLALFLPNPAWALICDNTSATDPSCQGRATNTQCNKTGLCTQIGATTSCSCMQVAGTPTLSTWGVIFMGAALVSAGAMVLRRREQNA
jgi:hypothetical protein